MLEQGIDQMREEEKRKEADDRGDSYDVFYASDQSLSRERSAGSLSPSEGQKEGSVHKSLHERSGSKSSLKSVGDKKDELEEAKGKEGVEEVKAPTNISEQEAQLLDLKEKQDREKLLASLVLAREENERLKKESGDLQHEVATYLQKKDIQPAAGDASMNQLKYINALVNSTQVRMQMKQTQESYNKMAQELQAKLQYHQERSNEMKASFKDFKRAVAECAEFNRTGKKLTKKELDRWEKDDDAVDEELKQERFTYITNKRKTRVVEEELKKKDKLAEGLHVIDFEQLKIENQTLNEKIEERNAAIHMLNTKIRKSVIMYTHMREKLHQLNQEYETLVKKEGTVNGIADKALEDKKRAKDLQLEKEKEFQKKKKAVGYLSLL
jgi:hypothetical protein